LLNINNKTSEYCESLVKKDKSRLEAHFGLSERL